MVNSLSDCYLQLIQYNKERLIELLNPIVDIHYLHFQQTDIHSQIPHLTRTFNYVEQDTLEKEIYVHFAIFIRNLSQLCPSITRTETVICCLAFRFPMKIIGLCLGYTSTDTVRQHKFRIRNKMMVDSDNSFLFDFIFRK
ncbi:MAG: hypothetical protein FWF53_09565 [Candidatus Azobacteroides sp.]|nr:hypothetical protein [Candidatus Azobacteroides sp.]